MRRLPVLIIVLGLLLTALSFAAPVAALTDHCPDHEGNPGKVQSVTPGDLDEVVLDAGTLVCVKAGTEATGIVTADGEQSLCDILITAGILDGSGETCRNVSYYIIYEAPPPPPPGVLLSVVPCPDGVTGGAETIQILTELELSDLRLFIEGSEVLFDGSGVAAIEPGTYNWVITEADGTTVLAEGTITVDECAITVGPPPPPPPPPGTGGPETPEAPPLVPDTAVPPLQNVAFMGGLALILLGSLLVINAMGVRRRRL